MNKIILILAMFFGLCLLWYQQTRHDTQAYLNDKPPFVFESFFNGPIRAWGMVQNYRGNVIKKMTIDMIGTWHGQTGTLDETFHENGQSNTAHRLWRIKRITKDTFEAQADDIIGTATGKIIGNALYWQYAMNVDVGGKMMVFDFDDWMWLMPDGVSVMNRSAMKKWGITVANITFFMQKNNEHA